MLPCILPLGISVSLAQSIGGDFPSVSIQRGQDENPADGQIVGLAVRLAELEFPAHSLDEEGFMRQFPDSVESDHRPHHRIVGPVVVLDLDVLREGAQKAGGRIAQSVPAGLRELELREIVCVADDAPPS